METDAYDLMVYWENRAETADACGARLARMLANLAEIDPVFQKWCKPANSRAAANKPFCKMPPDVEELSRIFDKNRCYTDIPRVVWPEQGFMLGVWNGLDDPFGVSLSVHAGVYDHVRSTPNKIEISISERRLATGRPWSGNELKPLLLAVTDAWDARSAVINGNRYLASIPRKATGHYLAPWAGWLTWLAAPLADQITPPEGAAAERLPNGALLVTLSDEPFDTDNPRHMTLAAEMQQAMRPLQASA